MRRNIALVCVIACATFSLTQAKVMKGTVDSDNGFAFGGKFCFQDLPTPQVVGNIEANLAIPISGVGPTNGSQAFNISSLNIVMYDDQQESWPTFLSNYQSWTCRQMLAARKFMLNFPACTQRGWKRRGWQVKTDGDQCWSLSPDGSSYQINVVIDGITQATRPRFWFVAFLDCDSPNGFANLDLHLHFTQTSQSSWNHEFGSESTGINSLYLLFFFVFALLLVIHGYGTWKLSQQLQYVHPLVKLFWIILVVEFFSILALLLHYGTYARDGIGMVSLQKFGSVCDVISRCFFILLLLLVAKGWTISSEKLTHRIPIVALVGSYLAFSIGIVLWSYSTADPMESQPNETVTTFTILLAVVWLAFGFYYTFQLIRSYRRELNPSKSSMYMRMGVFVPWMLLPPVASFLSFIMDPWARDRVVIAFTLSITVLAYAILSFLFWPSRAEKTFAIATPDVSSGGVNSGYEQL